MNYVDQYGVEYSADIKTLIKAPKEIEGDYIINSGVTTIARSAFYGCDKLTRIHLPSTFKKLENAAFTGCKALKAVYYNGDLYDWLQVEWNSCFDTGYSLYLKGVQLEEATIPTSISVIKHSAFYFCNSLKKVNLHEGISEIEASAFNKSGLSGVLTIPEGVTSIKQFAFFCCTSLASIKLPASLTNIWYGAFSCCYSLKHITISKDNPQYKTAIGVLYDKDGTLKAIAPCATNEILTLPSDIHRIDADTFCYSAVPKGGVFLSKNITELAKEAFLKVEKLTIYIPVGTMSYFKTLGIPMDNVQERFSIDSAFLPDHNCISAISNNPFRILGVYSNASQKEITANARKIKRFLEVGKAVEFPSDMNGLLPHLNRTTDMVDNALASLTNPQEKFKHSLFWFIKVDDADGIALDNLQAGNAEKASEIFEEHESWSTYVNMAVLAFAEKRFEDAVDLVTGSIYEDYYDEKLAEIVCGEEFEVDYEDIARTYVDYLLVDITLPGCRALFKEWGQGTLCDDYLTEKLLTQYTKSINDAISAAKSVPDDDANASLAAARKLKESTQASLDELAQYVGEDSAEYGMIADRLANQILQSSINFYNASIDRYAVFDAIELTKNALSIVKGQVKKDRCQQNLDILKKIAAKVPPKAVRDEDEFLLSYIAKHRSDSSSISTAWDILEACAPAIVRIKECLGATGANADAHEHMDNYLKMASTAIVNMALSKLIDAVNNATQYDTKIIVQAWDIMLNMDNFPMQDDFKNGRYQENRKTLRSIREAIITIGIMRVAPSKPSRVVDLRSSEEVWNTCKTINDYESFIKRFPKSTRISTARTRIDQLKKEAEDKLWQKAQDADDYMEYISLYPNGRYIEEALLAQQIADGKRDDKAFNDCKTHSDYYLYIRNYPNGRHHEEAQNRMDKLIQEDHQLWKSCSSQADYENYLNVLPLGKHTKEAKAKITRIKKFAEFLKWFIAIELITVFLLVIYVTCSAETFRGWTNLMVIGFVIGGSIIAAVKYGKQ